MNMTDASRSAFGNPISINSNEKIEATAAATIPRGAMKARKTRSRQERNVPMVESATETGRTTSTSEAKNSRLPGSV